MAKTAADCKLLLGAMAKTCSVDPFSKNMSKELQSPVKELDLKKSMLHFHMTLVFV